MKKIYDCNGKKIKEGDKIIDLIGQQVTYYDEDIEEYVDDYEPQQGIVIKHNGKLYAKFNDPDSLIDLSSYYCGEPISEYMKIL